MVPAGAPASWGQGRAGQGLAGVREERWPSARQRENNVTLCFPLTEEGALIYAWITHLS